MLVPGERLTAPSCPAPGVNIISCFCSQQSSEGCSAQLGCWGFLLVRGGWCWQFPAIECWACPVQGTGEDWEEQPARGCDHSDAANREPAAAVPLLHVSTGRA